MEGSSLDDRLQALFPERVEKGVRLSRFTTLGVGGPAQYFLEVKTVQEMAEAVQAARLAAVPYFVLGAGSNVVIADKGLQGLVIRNDIVDFEFKKPDTAEVVFQKVSDRHEYANQAKDIDVYEPSHSSDTDPVYVKIGTGMKVVVAITKCLQQGITGLEWFSGIPGTVGGAVYMNIHGGAKKFFSDFIYKVEGVNEKNKVVQIPSTDLGFDYDYSNLHNRTFIATGAYLRLFKGDVEKARRIVTEWGRDKLITQPQRTCGCMFQNLTENERREAKLPTPSVGYIVDRVLGLKGKTIGGAQISQKHAAFIENTGAATAEDVRQLTELVEKRVKEKLGIMLKREVEFIGF